jgi:hypothetical protein
MRCIGWVDDEGALWVEEHREVSRLQDTIVYLDVEQHL